MGFESVSLGHLCVNLKNQHKGLVIGTGPLFAFPGALSGFPSGEREYSEVL